MDEQKFLSLLGFCAKSGNIVYGAQGCIIGIKKRQIKLLLIDSDASQNTKNEFKNKCLHNNIKCFIWEGEPFSTRTAKPQNKLFGIKSKDFADKLTEYLKNDTPGV